ncbi:TIGR03751 family conjugal transfer lipoprotein [Pseudomonas sp. MYb185]|jgi:conjugative transfer region lipoprotein (TIGR03751 family)|uniref:TIGR03751 family conjugal transfer lipoprotein n=1 Tax=Pseudomonas sp. MYb185 TaxID=1848729 RepID=UPI000CFD0117|nr:TIGR03751 family conjugal transfer lipoprotein [Pseudomonas sp. MYb185]PRB81522.1 TIGR03751 family conjugal transfer lipoprotein [Pseudomonas sp. MYb185]
MNFPKIITVALLGAALAGCATSKDELMPHGDQTMQDLWRQSASGRSGDNLSQQALLDARSDLRRPMTDGALVEQRIHHTRTAANEIYSQFARLPNPDLVMYVFPHLAGGEPVPVPGYSTVFPLYSRPQYAMPGDMARPQLNPLDRMGRAR